MGCILIADSISKNFDCYGQLLSEQTDTLDFAKSAMEAEQKIQNTTYDVVIINTPLSDEFGDTLALYCVQTTSAGVVMLVKPEHKEEETQLEARGVFVLEKPFQKPFFKQVIRLLKTTRHRLFGLQSENVQLKKSIEKNRIVDRAKCVLMERLSFTEEQAYSYIKRHAMDMRVTKEKVAQAVLATYGGTDPLKKE